jgi:hypothetical protein
MYTQNIRIMDTCQDMSKKAKKSKRHGKFVLPVTD